MPRKAAGDRTVFEVFGIAEALGCDKHVRGLESATMLDKRWPCSTYISIRVN